MASENIAEEHRPCAIIIAKAPDIPQLVRVITPATIRPICPIDE